MKKILLFLLLTIPFTLSSKTYSGKCGEHLTWKIKNRTLIIEGYGEMYNWRYTEDKTVAPWRHDTIGGKGCSRAYSKVQTIILPEGLTSIGDNAFVFMDSLKTVNIPSTCKIIGSYAFALCRHLKQIEIPNSIIEIGVGAFERTALKRITIPQNVQKIGEGAFSTGYSLEWIEVSPKNLYYCSLNGVLYDKYMCLLNCYPSHKKDTVFVVPNSVINIGNSAFEFCQNLRYITIPNSVLSIGYSAFQSCYNLRSINIPASVIVIGSAAFKWCDNLNSVKIDANKIVSKDYTKTSSFSSIFGEQVKEYIIGDHVTAIGDFAFYGCRSMVSVIIGKNVTSIGYEAFARCSSLSSVTIPEGVSTIGKGDTFDHCTSLKKVQWNAKECILDLYEKGKFHPPFSGSNSITDFSFGDNVKEIPNCLCFNIKTLTSISIPNSVTTIKQSAFRQCENLTYVTIGNSVKSLGCCIFQDCNNLKEIKYPDGLDLSKTGIPAPTKLTAYSSSPTQKKKVFLDPNVPKITWLSDQSSLGKYTFKVGIKSNSKIDTVNVYVNGYLIKERGIVSVDNDGYDMVVNKTVDVSDGQNIIKIEVVDASGKTFSSTKSISYIDKKSPTTGQQKCIALVMGNANYIVANKLKNPVNDATDFASKLENLGFTVIRSIDQTRKGMDLAIRDFGNQAKNYDVALFYYAGHGMQYDGINYLIPIDADFHEQRDAKYNCVNMYEILEIMDDANCPMKIVVLDACRNNPFRSWVVRGENSGLCNMTAPTGTFIAFSTAPGRTALDGQGRNSPYTTALLQMLDVPGLSLTDFFQEVLEKVAKETGEKQNPWTSGSFRGKFYFNKK